MKADNIIVMKQKCTHINSHVPLSCEFHVLVER